MCKLKLVVFFFSYVGVVGKFLGYLLLPCMRLRDLGLCDWCWHAYCICNVCDQEKSLNGTLVVNSPF